MVRDLRQVLLLLYNLLELGLFLLLLAIPCHLYHHDHSDHSGQEQQQPEVL